MKFFHKSKDGGLESTVTGYWLVEIKSLFSIVLLRFDSFSREAYHTHAFNSLSWLIKGRLFEKFYQGGAELHLPSFKPFITKRDDFHKVDSLTDRSWVLSFRGPWSKHWKEFHPNTGQHLTLANGRKVVDVEG